MWIGNFLFVAYFFYSSLQDEIDDDRVNLTQLVKNFTRPTTSPVGQVITIYNGDNTLSNDTFMEIINFFNLSNCIQFRNVSKTQLSKGFNLTNGSYNDIIIDKSKNITTIQLNENCSKDDVCIRYFFGLALGMIPQVNREDRDEYVYVIDNYTVSEKKHNYLKLNSSLFQDKQFEFDFGSFFNRNPNYGSEDSRKVYTTIIGCQSYYDKMLGQRLDYSFGDRRTLCNYYNIKAFPNVTCQNGGFYNFKTNDCTCPNGYIGRDCSTLQQMPNCGFQNNSAETSEKYIFACGNKTCYYEINSTRNKSIEIEILTVNTKNVTPCVPYNALEIRHREDKGATGLSLCGHYNDTISLTSISKKVFIGYNGGPDDYFLMSYRTAKKTSEKTNKKTNGKKKKEKKKTTKNEKKKKENSNDNINLKTNFTKLSNLDELNCTKLKELEHST
uniref:Astacin domain-containing protein n=1 Tax=Parastrongyloides trichosuri TaxID=131310 RepID=A0A0N4ZM00_PARTI